MKELSSTEAKALYLVQSDLNLIQTLYTHCAIHGSGFLVSMLPYIGLIVEGCRKWSEKVSIVQKSFPNSTPDKRQFYTDLRLNIKLWDTSFDQLYWLLQSKYNESDLYFANICKKFAKFLNLYDIFGAQLIDENYIDNTILDMIFVPEFHFELDQSYIKDMASFAGELVVFFNGNSAPYRVNENLKFHDRDFGGFIKSPFGRSFNYKFVLFSILCSINLVLYGVNEYILDEAPLKLRFSYILYYYLVQNVPDVNKSIGTNFSIDPSFSNASFRNSMAHYGLGSVLRQDEVILSDAFGGLTLKLFGMEWLLLKDKIINELRCLALQMKNALDL